MRYPASMGLSVFLPPGAGDNIAVRVWYAGYDKVEVPIEHTDRKHSGWKRVPHGPVLVTVPLDAVKLKKNGKFPVPESRGLVIQGELRETNRKGLEPNRRGESSTDDDQRVLALLFRDYMEWAVGHNTSVVRPEVECGKVTRLRTTQIPTFEVPAVKH